MLYTDSVSKDTLVVVKGWAEKVNQIRSANLAQIKDLGKREDMNVRKQLIDQIELSSSLADTLAKTYSGAVVLALEKGEDPSKVADPGKQFTITDISGKKKGLAAIPPDWERSLCAMYTRGFEQVPLLGAKTAQELGTLIAENPIDRTTPGDENAKLDTKAASKFLNEMKACKVSVVDKADPVAGDIARQDQLGAQSMKEMKSIYGRLPDLAGAELDPEVKAVSSEYGPAPSPVGPGSNDDDGDATGANN